MVIEAKAGHYHQQQQPIKRVNTCAYCKGHTHLINPDNYPNDAYATEAEPGKWMCGNCIDTMEENIVLRNSNPTSERYCQVLAKRQRNWTKR